MTFKAKPVVKRAQRPGWENQDRRNFYMNLGFGIIVALAVIILIVAGVLSWYDEHLTPVASVDGQSITRDEFRDRYLIEGWRLDEAERQVRTAVVGGYLSEAAAQSQLQTLAGARDALASIALERLIDSKLQAKLAAEEGISATPDEVEAKLLDEATTPEQRHVWAIEVAPETDPGTAVPTPVQETAAKAAADAALKDLLDGKAWEDVAVAVSTNTANAAQGGDLGWLQATETQLDAKLVAALFAATVNTPTAVLEGADGVFRIGRVTEIVTEAVDDTYQVKLTNDKIELDKYRIVVLADVIHQKLEDKIVANVTKPGPQRQVQQIYLAEAGPALAADAIKTRHILYSPKDDPSAASTVPEDDPSWKTAEDEARAAHAALVTDPAQFDSMAREQSDEVSATGPTGSGGKLPYFDSASGLDEAFKAAILVPGLKAGDLLDPVKSAFGWHVIQVMYLPPDLDHLNALKALADDGADFAALARDNSEAESAGAGGDLGWIARGQLAESLIDAIFAAPIGRTSAVVTVEGDGLYLFKVIAEEVRTPEGSQLEELRASAFSDWYEAKKSAVTIVRDTSGSIG